MYLILSDILNVIMACFCLVMLVYTCLHYWKWGGFMTVIGLTLVLVFFSAGVIHHHLISTGDDQLAWVLELSARVTLFAGIAFCSSGATLAHIRQKYPQEHPEPKVGRK